MILGFDTATRLTAEKARAIRNDGYEFAGRYLVPATGSLKWKALTKAEAEDITNAGLKLLTVYETTANRAASGMAAGAVDGAQAYKCAKDIGMPVHGIIYFAVDFSPTTEQLPTIESYFRAARKQTPEYDIGVYGPYHVIEYLANVTDPPCCGYWQCVGWSYGKKSAARNVYQAKWQQQSAGVAIDVNECEDMLAAGIWDYKEENMTGEQIYNKLNEYLANQPVPDWAQKEYAEAIKLGITDGERPMQLIPRYQASMMAKRAYEKAMEEK